MISYDQLRSHYLADLTLPDVHHGRETPKVRNPAAWAAITGSPGIEINPYDRDVWVWSDIHFGHKNIIKYTHPHRPYESPEHMDRELINNYLRVVKQDDIVIWCGDIGFKSVNAINEILHELPGYKVWIVGNHDMHRDGSVYNLHMDERHVALPVQITDPADGNKYQLLFTHYPLTKIPAKCVNVHGHIHQHLADPWNINVCVEHTNCAPINLRDVCVRAKAYLDQTK